MILRSKCYFKLGLRLSVQSLVLLAILFIGATYAMAQDTSVTFTPKTDKGHSTYLSSSSKVLADTLTKENVTICGTDAAFNVRNNTEYRIGSSCKLSISVNSGSIKKVVFSIDSNHDLFATCDKGKLDAPKYNERQWTGNSSSLTLTFTHVSWLTKIVVTYEPNVKVTPTKLTFENLADRVFSLNQKVNSFTNIAVLEPSISNASILYYSSNPKIASLSNSNDGSVSVFTEQTGEATITAKFKGNDYYLPSEASYIVRVLPTSGDTELPYSVSDAALFTNSSELPQGEVYVKGVVKHVTFHEDESSCDYVIVDQSGGAELLQVLGGKYLNNADVTSSAQIAEGDQVVVCGKLEVVEDVTTGKKSLQLSKANHIAHFWGNDLTIDEKNEENEIGNMRHATVQLFRNFNKNAWNSLVLPFDMTEDQVKQVFGSSAQLENYKGTTLNDDGSYTLNFEPTTTITANQPVFVYGAKNINQTIEDVEVKDGPATFTPAGAAFAFTGSYDKMSLHANDWFISSDNNFYLAIGSESMKAMRAVFRPVKEGTAPQSLKSNLIERPTDVDLLKMDNISSSNAPVFNMWGQRVSEHYHGIVIKGGKKYVNP